MFINVAMTMLTADKIFLSKVELWLSSKPQKDEMLIIMPNDAFEPISVPFFSCDNYT